MERIKDKLVKCSDKYLSIDESCLQINTNNSVSIYSQITECYQCDVLPLTNITSSQDIIFKTVYPTKLFIANPQSNCSLLYHFSQHSKYSLNISENESGNLNCSHIYTIKPGDDVYKPLWILLCSIILSLILLGLIVSVKLKLFQKYVNYVRTNPALRELHNDLGEPGPGLESDRLSARLVGTEPLPSPYTPYRNRIKAIDAFRGITIVLMIFVNSGGGQYSIFQHSPWNGLTIADVIFPWFVWVMGFSLVMSVKNQIRAERRRSYLFISSVRRSLTLIVIGIILNSIHNVDLSVMRLPGVLQRIAVTYFIVSCLQICFVTPEYISVGNSCVDKLSDILSLWVQWIVILIFIALHTYISLYVPYEHCPAGYLGPGGLSNNSQYYNCTGGIASYIDRIVFTNKHMYQHSTEQAIYHTTIPVDPEGLLGILTSCLCAFLGVQAGQILISFYNPNKRLSRWLLWATITGLAGGLLCDFSKEGGLIPVNKNLWSLSYCLVTSSMAFIMLILLYLVIDRCMFWNGFPFIQTGRNSIFLYFCSSILGNMFPFSWKPFADSFDHTEYLAMNVFATTLWIIIACILDKNKFYLTIR